MNIYAPYTFLYPNILRFLN